MKIKNNTGHVVVVYNEFIYKEIPDDGEIIISDDEVRKDSLINLRYFSPSTERKEVTSTVERGLDRGLYVNHENKSVFPLITTVDLKDAEYVILENSENEVPLILMLLFKKIVLKSVSVKIKDKKIKPIKSDFSQSKDKKRFLSFVGIELIVSSLLFLLSLCSLALLFIPNESIGLKIAVSVIFVMIFTVWIIHLKYFLKGVKGKL